MLSKKFYVKCRGKLVSFSALKAQVENLFVDTEHNKYSELNETVSLLLAKQKFTSFIHSTTIQTRMHFTFIMIFSKLIFLSSYL